jgi:hypothetical protein
MHNRTSSRYPTNGACVWPCARTDACRFKAFFFKCTYARTWSIIFQSRSSLPEFCNRSLHLLNYGCRYAVKTSDQTILIDGCTCQEFSLSSYALPSNDVECPDSPPCGNGGDSRCIGRGAAGRRKKAQGNKARITSTAYGLDTPSKWVRPALQLGASHDHEAYYIHED